MQIVGGAVEAVLQRMRQQGAQVLIAGLDTWYKFQVRIDIAKDFSRQRRHLFTDVNKSFMPRARLVPGQGQR